MNKHTIMETQRYQLQHGHQQPHHKQHPSHQHQKQHQQHHTEKQIIQAPQELYAATFNDNTTAMETNNTTVFLANLEITADTATTRHT
jgi:hypothetical protein